MQKSLSTDVRQGFQPAYSKNIQAKLRACYFQIQPKTKIEMQV